MSSSFRLLTCSLAILSLAFISSKCKPTGQSEESSDSCIASENSVPFLQQRPTHTQQYQESTWQTMQNRTERNRIKTLPGPLTAAQIDTFFDDGFVILPDVVSNETLNHLRNDMESIIDNLANALYASGKIESFYNDSGWTARLLQMTRDYEHSPLILMKKGILPPHFQTLFADHRFSQMATQLGVGEDIALHPAWNIRSKMPNHEETVVPWHQDNSYWEPRLWDEPIVTFWISLVDANRNNGCMQFIRGGHRDGKTFTHSIGTTTSTWYTELAEDTMRQELMEEDLDIVTAEVSAGTVIVFSGHIPHRSLNSISQEIRWSTDFRLHPARSAKKKGFSPSPFDWFYGVKDSLKLVDSEDDGYVAVFDEWANVDRTEQQDESMAVSGDEEEEFDPIVVGPWMDLWNITAHIDGKENPHLDRYMALPADKKDIGRYLENDVW